MMASGHRTVCRAWRVYPPRLACKAANTFSAVLGKSITRTPTASNTALAMTAAGGRLQCGVGTRSKPVEPRRIVHQDLLADRQLRRPHLQLVQ
jgi:hypothetical protein